VKEGSIVWADGVLDTASIICSYQWLRYDKKNKNAGAVICAVKQSMRLLFNSYRA